MSLMLNALRRIEARQTPVCAEDAPGVDARIALPSSAAPAEPILPPPALHADDLASLPLEALASPEPVSLEAAFDQLQTFVSAAGLFDDCKPQQDLPECRDAAEPAAVVPVASDPYATTAQQILRQLPRARSHTLLFTSAADGQGKTMTLARLAPCFSQAIDGNVLVVDANLRNPDMARWLAVAPTRRLPEVLAGAADWASAVQTTTHARLSLLAGGTDNHTSRAAGNAQAVGYLLRDLVAHYELVVVDAASLAHPETAQIAAACDATYLVVRLGETSPRMLREAAQVIQLHGGRLLGCVAIDAAI